MAERVPGDLLSEAQGLRARLAERLGALRAAAAGQPSDNPIVHLALELLRRRDAGGLAREELEGLVRLLTLRAFVQRAERLGEYIGETEPAANATRLAALVRRLATDGDGRPLPFERFRARLEREVFGVVITAHPTFGVAPALVRALACLALDRAADGTPLSDAARRDLLAEVAAARHGAPERPRLADEQDFALGAIANLQQALGRFQRLALREAAALYPQAWQGLRPRPLTVASWVGYDLDGRADIRWTDTLRARLTVALRQLQRYRAETAAIAAAPGSPAAGPLAELATALDEGVAAAERDLALLPDDSEATAAVARFNRALAARRGQGWQGLRPLIERAEAALAAAPDLDTRIALAALCGEMRQFGLGVAHTHVRLNATQLENAIRAEIGQESALDDVGHRRRYWQRLNELLEAVAPETINFGSVMAERTSAKRLFMLVAQMLKYVDEETPIRFLIAETESAFTALTALYFARLFGVEARIDISPLFETAAALQHGHEIVAELLANPHYRRYLETRGRLCIQTGYSDSGRYIGVVPAALAIERLRIKVAEALAAAGLADVELVVFDTFGESIGRGSHPAGFAERLAYIDTPHSRLRFARLGLAVKEEMSFQGGDGYVHFATPDMAFATLTRLLEHALAPPGAAGPDLLYEDTDYSLEFFIAVKALNDRLMADPDYGALLHAFGANLLFPAGSRATKREHESHRGVEHASPSQIRAIPHNATLQQLGYLANALAGLGRAIAVDPERFAQMHAGSPRTRSLMRLVARARALSSLDVLGAYVELLNPVAWLRMAYAEDQPRRRQQMRRLAELLHEQGRYAPLNRVQRVLLADAIDLQTGLAAAPETGPAEALERPPESPPHREDLDLLHALRLALIGEVFLLATRVPRFTSQPDITVEDVLGDLLHLDVDRAIAVLQRAFPVAGEIAEAEAFGEPATYRSDRERGYGREHRELFEPMLADYDLIRRIGSAVAHLMGAVG